jgi:hypothetical protein
VTALEQPTQASACPVLGRSETVNTESPGKGRFLTPCRRQRVAAIEHSDTERLWLLRVSAAATLRRSIRARSRLRKSWPSQSVGPDAGLAASCYGYTQNKASIAFRSSSESSNSKISRSSRMCVSVRVPVNGTTSICVR